MKSKQNRSLILIAALGAAIGFCGVADAGPFGLFGRDKVNKQVQNTTNGSSCVYGKDGTCLTHEGAQAVDTSGPVSAADLERAGGEFYVQAPATTKANAEATDVPAQGVEVDSAAATSVAEAEADLAAAEQNLLDKKEALTLAIVAQNQADAREALDRLQADDSERRQLQQEIDDRTARLESLQPEETD